MSKVINALTKHIEELTKLENFIIKTKEKSGKFSEAVIARLIIEFETKQDVVLEEAVPLAKELQEEASALQSEYDDIKSKFGDDERLQELDLRLEIGAIEQAEYDAQVSDIKGSLQGLEDRVSVLEKDLHAIGSVLERWAPFSGISIEEQQSLPEAEEIPEVQAPEDDLSVPHLEEAPPPPVEVENQFEVPSLDSHLEEVQPSEGEEAMDEFSSSPYGTLDVGEDINFDLSDDNFGFEDSVEFSAELVSPEEFSSNIESNFAEEVPEAEVEEQENDEPRSAILLRDEGHPTNETVFPFQGENYTIGRAAENNIQIKNDSKVSRKHCRLTRRANQFYIQDLESSNGTVVNGELIQERRLLGGEEIKVGETIFRFSIQ